MINKSQFYAFLSSKLGPLLCLSLLCFGCTAFRQQLGQKPSLPESNHSQLQDRVNPNSAKNELEIVSSEFSPRKNIQSNALSQSDKLRTYCDKIDKVFNKYHWQNSHCSEYEWNHVRNSVKSDPLLWVTYGDESKAKEERSEITLILCGVHGDEITPIKFCFDIMNHLDQHPMLYQGRLVVVAPIVNPDSFFKSRPTRTNARKIDINRNFPTNDWNRDARRLWATRYRKDPRRYPGEKSLSEPEVVFQVNLIKRYSPDKIISVHAPLTLLDYDGPKELQAKGEAGKEGATELLIQMSKKANDYKITNYPFFPGSLGNWAGNELNIPTYTLELPSSDNSKSQEYWQLFKEAIHGAILHDLREKDKVATVAGPSKTQAEGQNGDEVGQSQNGVNGPSILSPAAASSQNN